MKERKAIVRPFIYVSSSVGVECRRTIVLLSLQVLLLFVTKSFMAVFVVLSAVSASVIANVICTRIKCIARGNYYSYSMSIVQGFVVGMFLPETYPPLTVFLVTFCTMVLGKYVFRNFYYDFINPSIFILAVLSLIGAGIFGSSGISLDMLASRNPSQALIENGFFPISSFDSVVTDFLNKTVFSIFKVSIPEGYVSMLWDTHSAIPAFRFNLLTLISSIVVFMFDGAKAIIPASFVVVYLCLVRFVSPLFVNGIPAQGDILLAALTSGTLFVAVFVIDWYGSVPKTIVGKILFGVVSGILAFFICGCGNSSVGMVFTVLVADFISIFIQHFEMKRNFASTSLLVNSFLRNSKSSVSEVH